MKIICIILCAVIILTVLYFAFAFFGNPVSWMLARKNSNQFLKENFPETDYEISRVCYNFKTGGYYADVVSPTSQDSYFTIDCNGWGQYQFDTYEAVTNMSNTISRLDREYRKLVKSKLYEGNGTLNSGIAYGEFRIAGIYEVHTYTTEDGSTEYYTLDKEYGLDRDALEIDGQYDIRELARTAGRITLHIHDEEISVERAAELLLQVRDYLDENNIPFYAIDFDLRKPKNEYGQSTGGSVSVYDFLYSDIYPEGMTERVQENRDALQEHHTIQDAERARDAEEYANNPKAETVPKNQEN